MTPHSRVSEQLLLYPATLDVGHFPVTISVALLSSDLPSAQSLADSIVDFLDEHPASSEVWILVPAPSLTSLTAIANDDTLQRRLQERTQIALRAFAIHLDGAWVEGTGISRWSKERVLTVLNSNTQSAIMQAGLRAIFVDSEALLTGHAGYHFGKPGGSHSKQFIRAASAVGRSLHAELVAVALLMFTTIGSVRRVWVDTAGILPVAHALARLRHQLSPGSGWLVSDTFGGYEGADLATARMSDDDLILVSSSTSGGLARTLRERHGVTAPILTLYYLSEKIAPDGIVCDLTQRDDQRSTTFLTPYQSWPARKCGLCKDHEVAITLEGDGFLPSTGTLTTRRIVRSNGEVHLSNLLQLTGGANVFRVVHPRGDRIPAARLLATRLSAALDSRNGSADLKSEIFRSVTAIVADAKRDIDVIVHLADEDSTQVARTIADDLGPNVTLLTETEDLERGIPSAARHVLIVAAVTSSGRSVLNVSRELRFLKVDTATSYLLPVAHPESEYAWDLFTSTLGVRGPGTKNIYRSNWVIPRERAKPPTPTPWDLEERFLQYLVEADRCGDADELVSERMATLQRFADEDAPKRLFVPAQFGQGATNMPALAQHFVFWDFDWEGDLGEEAVFSTIAAALHKNSRLAEKGQYAFLSEAGQRFVLAPAMFDRFNDPVIQSSLLRAASRRELDYSFDSAVSRSARDLVEYTVSRHAQPQGAAATEFLLSLCLGKFDPSGPHLRLRQDDLSILIEALKSLPVFPAYLEMLRKYLTSE